MNPPTVEELKQLLDSGVWPISRDGVINTVKLTACLAKVNSGKFVANNPIQGRTEIERGGCSIARK
jgi:hypothetical protein